MLPSVSFSVAQREKKRGCRDEVSQSEDKSDEEETNNLVVDSEKNPP